MHLNKLSIQRAQLNAKGIVTPVRLYLTADHKRVVTDGKEAAFLLASAGSEVPPREADKYGVAALLASLTQKPAAPPIPAAPPVHKKK